MIGWHAAATDDHQISTRLTRAGAHDTEVRLRVELRRTRARHQQPARCQTTDRGPVQMSVQRSRAFQIFTSSHQRRRIEDHDVVLLTVILEEVGDVGAHGCNRFTHGIAARVRLRRRHRGLRRVDAHHPTRAAQCRAHAPPAHIAIKVEHARAAIELRETRPVVGLIEEPAGLLSFRQVHLERRFALDHQRPRIAAPDVDVRRQTFRNARAVRVLHDERRGRDQRVDRGDDPIERRFHSPRRGLYHACIAVAVDDQTGQFVAFAVYPPIVRLRVQPVAPAQRAFETPREQRVIDRARRG